MRMDAMAVRMMPYEIIRASRTFLVPLSIRTLPGAADSGIWPKAGLEECNFRTDEIMALVETIEAGLEAMGPFLSPAEVKGRFGRVEMDLDVRAAKRGLGTS